MKKLIALLTIALSVSAMASTHTCGGSNPSWELTVSDKALVSKTATETLTSKVQAINTSNDYAFVAKTASGATVTVIGGECTNGQYDSIYLRHIIYTTADGKVLYGCCDERD